MASETPSCAKKKKRGERVGRGVRVCPRDKNKPDGLTDAIHVAVVARQSLIPFFGLIKWKNSAPAKTRFGRCVPTRSTLVCFGDLQGPTTGGSEALPQPVFCHRFE
jgi:hypothetical protein